jgi:hypothetical protein
LKQRKKANRTKESYHGKTPEARAKQRGNLRRGGTRKTRPEILAGSGKVTQAQLDSLNVVEFAEHVLKVSFEERPLQRTVLKSIYGLELTPEEREQYLLLTGDELMPDGTVFEEKVEKREALLAFGARSGKSLISSIIACWEAVQSKWRRFLQDEEKAYVQLYATRELQSQQIIGQNCQRLLEGSRIAHLIEDVTISEVALTNGITIRSFACGSTGGRGLSTVLLVGDEAAFFRTVGPKTLSLILGAITPRMSQFEAAIPKTVLISTVQARVGVFWQMYSEGPRVKDRLIMKAATRTLNPCIEQSFIDRERLRDPANAEMEYDSIFAHAVDAFFGAADLDKCFVLPGDLPPAYHNRYFMGLDQAGAGAVSKDRFGLCICHKEGEQVLVDVVREWASKDLDKIFSEIGTLAKEYKIHSAVVDRYASGYVENFLAKIGLIAESRPTVAVCYVNGKRLITAARLQLPVNKNLRAGLLRTQCYIGRSQTLSIVHERSPELGHGDICDAVMTGIWACSRQNAGGYFSDVL